MIGLDPDVIWRCFGGRAEINTTRARARSFHALPRAAARRFAQTHRASQIATSQNLPPMAAGVFGYLGYDMVRQMEQLAPAKPDPIGVPDAIMIGPTIMVVFDT